MAQASSTPGKVRREGRHLLWTSTTYFGEGLPWSILHQLAMEFLTTIGVSKTQISATSLLHFPGTFRFAWSPIIDLVGKKRTWVWVMQLVLGVGMFFVAQAVPGHHLRPFWVAMIVLAVLLATHDIACDGFYLQALDQEERALFSGTRSAAFRVATWVGGSVLLGAAGLVSWYFAFSAAAALMIAVAAVNAIVMPRPAEHHPQEDAPAVGRKPSAAVAFLASYRSFLSQPQATRVLAFMLLYRLGDIMMFAMSSPMLQDMGIGPTVRSVLRSFQMVGFMAGSIVGGFVIARRGLARCLVPMTLIQNLMIPLYIGLAVWKPHFAGVAAIVTIEQVASGVGTAANSVFIMQRCRTTFAASHFAFATSLVSLTSTVSGFLSGPLNERVGHPWFFTIAFLASLPGLALAFFVPKAPLEPPAATPAGATPAGAEADGSETG